MCQCEQQTFNPYPYAGAYQYPFYGAVPYPTPSPGYAYYDQLYYDALWPSRVTPTRHPLEFVSTRRFRGEVRVGNCLLIYE